MIVTAGKGAAATGHHLTTQAALEIIKAGGNAFDGAIAAALMACVCEPVLASPGGGGFAMIHNGDKSGGKTGLLDFFARTPIRKNTAVLDFTEVEADFGAARQIFHIGQASSATPGFIPGLFAVHEKHARLPMIKLVAPARDAAAGGVEITAFQNKLSHVVAPILLNSRQSRKLFAPDGHLHRTGETFFNPQLAQFMDQLGAIGLKAFPTDAILTAQKKNGHLRREDFENYQARERKSLAVEVAGSMVHLNPLPAAGGVMVALALANLESEATTEIAALARALGKVDKARRKAGGDLDLLLAGAGPPAYRGTTHICVVDDQQNACSMTLSNGEGNGYLVGECGFMLNNMLGEADINPGGMLGWNVASRMSSMMCPTIVEHGDGAVLALGSGGSNRIRSTIFQVLVNLLISKQGIGQQGIRQAVEQARLHVENGHLDFEPFADRQIVSHLKTAFPDHRQWPDKNMFFGGCHVAGVLADGSFCGAGDQRRDGIFRVSSP